MKTETKPTHTPGPWKSKGNGDIVNRDTWIASVGTFTDSGTDSDEACKANARLIAVAPELLEALKSIIEVHHLGYQPSLAQWENALDAIAKAEGR